MIRLKAELKLNGRQAWTYTWDPPPDPPRLRWIILALALLSCLACWGLAARALGLL